MARIVTDPQGRKHFKRILPRGNQSSFIADELNSANNRFDASEFVRQRHQSG
jgi:hypothetical protein